MSVSTEPGRGSIGVAPAITTVAASGTAATGAAVLPFTSGSQSLSIVIWVIIGAAALVLLSRLFIMIVRLVLR